MKIKTLFSSFRRFFNIPYVTICRETIYVKVGQAEKEKCVEHCATNYVAKYVFLRWMQKNKKAFFLQCLLKKKNFGFVSKPKEKQSLISKINLKIFQQLNTNFQIFSHSFNIFLELSIANYYSFYQTRSFCMFFKPSYCYFSSFLAIQNKFALLRLLSKTSNNFFFLPHTPSPRAFFSSEKESRLADEVSGKHKKPEKNVKQEAENVQTAANQQDVADDESQPKSNISDHLTQKNPFAKLLGVRDYEEIIPQLEISDDLPQHWMSKLETTSDVSQVVNITLKVALSPELCHNFSLCAKKLKKLVLSDEECFVVLYCICLLDFKDKELLEKCIERIEARYFSSDLTYFKHNAFISFGEKKTFQELIEKLPIKYKTKIILKDDFSQEDGLLPPNVMKPLKLPTWNTMQPVDMEEVERKQTRVVRTRFVRASVSNSHAGKKIRSLLSLHLRMAIKEAPLEILSQIATIFMCKERIYKGDINEDTLEILSFELLKYDDKSIAPFLVSLTSSLRDKSFAYASRLWKKFYRAALNHFAFENQVLPYGVNLCGLQFIRDIGRDNKPEFEFLNFQSKLKLYCKFLSNFLLSPNISVNQDLFTALINPIKQKLNEILSYEQKHVEIPIILFLCEISLLLDSFAQGLCINKECATLILDLFNLQTNQIKRELFKEEEKCFSGFTFKEVECLLTSMRGTMADLCIIAHCLAFYEIYHTEASLIIWGLCSPHIKQMKPHFRLMLLNSVAKLSKKIENNFLNFNVSVKEFCSEFPDIEEHALSHICL